MKWSIEEVECLEWLVQRNVSLQALENVLYERTPSAILIKIKKLNLSNIKTYSKEYYQKSEIKNYHKKYHENNKETLKDYHKKYYADNKDTIKKHREDNKETIKDNNKNYFMQKSIPKNLEILAEICNNVNMPEIIETASFVYTSLRENKVNFSGENHYLYAIVNFALLINYYPQKIKELSKLAGVKPGYIIKLREKYKKILKIQ